MNFVLALLDLQTSTYAATKCPKCGQIGGVDNYDPMAGAWECPECKEVVVWVQGKAVSHFGQLRKRLRLGWFCRQVDALIQEREARKADEENRRRKYFGIETANEHG